jgi:hypothetical protein
MSKTALKQQTAQKQQERCALSKERLPEEDKLYDVHRKIPKRKGGEANPQNISVAIPTAHMQEHEILRVRQQELEELKMIIDDRQQTMKVLMKLNNQLLAYQHKTDTLNPETQNWLAEQRDVAKKRLSQIDKQLTKYVNNMGNPLAKIALNVNCIGPITVAYCLTYIDISKADHASSLWKYTGLHCASHERYTKGETSGGNKTLRTILYTMADSQVKGRGAYRRVYDRVKSRLGKSEKIVKSRNTQGQLVEVMWKDTKPSHRHGAALRAVMKHFLADYWWVGRTLAGLETSPLYPEAILGGGHRTIMPEERGWIY